MKKVLVAAIAICCVIMGCAVLKKNPTAQPVDRSSADSLDGAWNLNYISGPVAFEILYPEKKPFIHFDMKKTAVNGHTGCNSFFGNLAAVDGHKISFSQSMGMTKMLCPGQGEQVFMSTLRKADRFEISNDRQSMTLYGGQVALMRFSPK